MSTKTNTTIDDIGSAWYHRYEADKTGYDTSYSSYAKHIAEHLSTDAFMPLALQNEFVDIGKSGAPWSLLLAPFGFNEQKKRLFMNQQLAPKLGPEDLLDTLASRIQEKLQEEVAIRKKSTEAPGGNWMLTKNIKEVEHQGAALLEMVKLISGFNKMISSVEAEKYRYSKG